MDSGDDLRRTPSPPSTPPSPSPMELSPSPPLAKLLATKNTYLRPKKEIRPGDEELFPPPSQRTLPTKKSFSKSDIPEWPQLPVDDGHHPFHIDTDLINDNHIELVDCSPMFSDPGKHVVSSVPGKVTEEDFPISTVDNFDLSRRPSVSDSGEGPSSDQRTSVDIGENLSDEAWYLPPEILYEIFRHSWASDSLSSFTGVCKAWDSVILPEAVQFRKTLYLIMPHDVEDEQRAFYELYTGKIISKILPLLKGKMILSSCEGWLLVMGDRNDTVAIVNPLTGEQFVLPEIKQDRSLSVNGLLSCSPCRPKCKIVITFQTSRTTTVYFMKHGHGTVWDSTKFNINCGNNKTILGFLGDLVCICDPINCKTYYCHVFDQTCAGTIESPDRQGGRILISKNDNIFVLHGRELFCIQVNKNGEKPCMLVKDEKVIFTEDYRASFCDPKAFSMREKLPNTFSFPKFYFHVTRRSRYIHMYDFSTKLVTQYPCSFSLVHDKIGKCHWFEPCFEWSCMEHSVTSVIQHTSCCAPASNDMPPERGSRESRSNQELSIGGSSSILQPPQFGTRTVSGSSKGLENVGVECLDDVIATLTQFTNWTRSLLNPAAHVQTPSAAQLQDHHRLRILAENRRKAKESHENIVNKVGCKDEVSQIGDKHIKNLEEEEGTVSILEFEDQDDDASVNQNQQRADLHTSQCFGLMIRYPNLLTKSPSNMIYTWEDTWKELCNNAGYLLNLCSITTICEGIRTRHRLFSTLIS